MPVETSQLKMNDRFIMIQTDPDGAIFHIDFYKAEVDAFLHDGQWDIFMHEIEPYLFWLGRDMPPIKSA